MAQTWKDLLIKPALAGGISAFALRQLYGANANVSYFGRTFSITKVAVGMGVSAHFVNQIIFQFIMPHIQKERKLQHLESMAFSIGLNSAIFYFLPKLLSDAGPNLNANDTQNLVLAGAITEVLSQWLYEQFFTGGDAIFF